MTDPTVYDDNGEPFDLSRWTHKIVCTRCKGKGTHVNPNVDGHGITRDEMDELGDDFRDDYLSGVYDITCLRCHGDNVIDEIDFDRFERDAPELFAAYLRAEDAAWEADAIDRMERRYCG